MVKRVVFVLIVCLVSLVSLASASVENPLESVSLESHFKNIDPTTIPGEDYVTLSKIEIPYTGIVLRQPIMYKQVSEHIYYSPDTCITNEHIMVKVGKYNID